MEIRMETNLSKKMHHLNSDISVAAQQQKCGAVSAVCHWMQETAVCTLSTNVQQWSTAALRKTHWGTTHSRLGWHRQTDSPTQIKNQKNKIYAIKYKFHVTEMLFVTFFTVKLKVKVLVQKNKINNQRCQNKTQKKNTTNKFLQSTVL